MSLERLLQLRILFLFLNLAVKFLAITTKDNYTFGKSPNDLPLDELRPVKWPRWFIFTVYGDLAMAIINGDDDMAVLALCKLVDRIFFFFFFSRW